MLVEVYKVLDIVIQKDNVLWGNVFLLKFVVNVLLVNHKNKHIIAKKG